MRRGVSYRLSFRGSIQKKTETRRCRRGAPRTNRQVPNWGASQREPPLLVIGNGSLLAASYRLAAVG